MEHNQNAITLKAYYGKQQGKLSLNPVKDKITGRLKGVQLFSEEERRKAIRVVDADTTRDITDGLELNLSNEVDKIDWAWIKENKEISQDLESAKSNPSVLFYVDIPDTEIDKRLAKIDIKIQAITIVKEASDSRRRDLFRYMGSDGSSFRSKDILDYLYDKAEKRPEAILKASSDPKFKTKLFLFQLLDAKLIKKDQHGTYRYGDLVIGLNEIATMNWIDEPANRDLVGRFYLDLNGPRNSVMPSVINEFETLSGKNESNSKAGKPTEASKIIDDALQSMAETL